MKITRKTPLRVGAGFAAVCTPNKVHFISVIQNWRRGVEHNWNLKKKGRNLCSRNY